MARTHALLLTAALSAVLGFTLLIVALTTDYWSLLEVEDGAGLSGAKQLSSHSGLWQACDGQKKCAPLMDPFASPGPNVSPTVQHLLSLRRVFMVVLPLSLVLILCGWIIGPIGFLNNNIPLLVLTGCCFLLGGALTLSGVVVYISYSHLALAETYGVEHMQGVHPRFGWSLTLACCSCASNGLSGALLLLATRSLSMSQCQNVPRTEVI